MYIYTGSGFFFFRFQVQDIEGLGFRGGRVECFFEFICLFFYEKIYHTHTHTHTPAQVSMFTYKLSSCFEKINPLFLGSKGSPVES
jgi:hypothetical protein